jgi:hypothetical protein
MDKADYDALLQSTDNRGPLTDAYGKVNDIHSGHRTLERPWDSKKG